MDQIRRLFGSLSVRQRITIAIVAIVAGAALYGVVHWRKESDFRPLFTGLAAEDAGAVVQKVKESGTEYRLGEGGSCVMVPSARVAELRLALAAAGLPKSGRVGFEIFDKTNFGATEFTEQVNYRRALEGELERTVMSLSEVEQARVHLTFAKDSVFLESRQPAKASIVVRLRPGTTLRNENVAAVVNLVAGAVEGLAPEGISIVDSRGRLLNRARRPSQDGLEPSDAFIEYRQKMESVLVAKINSALEPLLGADKFRSVVSLDCDFTTADQSEEIFDPTKSVMTTSHRIDNGGTAPVIGGLPGTASNLPAGAQPLSAPAATLAHQNEEITYQTSRTVKHTRTPQGAIKKMSIAILLDHDARWEGSGSSARRVLVPPTPERLKSIRDMIAGMTGLTPDRGDQLVVESQVFEQTLNAEPPSGAAPVPPPPRPAEPPWLQQLRTNRTWQIGAAAGAVLVLLVFAAILRRPRRHKAVSAGAAVLEAGTPKLPAGAETPKLPAIAAAAAAELPAGSKEGVENTALQALKVKPVVTQRSEQLTKSLRENIEHEPEIAVNVLRSWIREEEA